MYAGSCEGNFLILAGSKREISGAMWQFLTEFKNIPGFWKMLKNHLKLPTPFCNVLKLINFQLNIIKKIIKLKLLNFKKISAPQQRVTRHHSLCCIFLVLTVHEIKMRENWNFLYSQNGCLLLFLCLFCLFLSARIE